MVEESIDELIRQLEALRVREDTLVQQIIQARARENQQQEQNTSAGVDSQSGS
jgi:cell division septum initiation protein DivIVA